MPFLKKEKLNLKGNKFIKNRPYKITFYTDCFILVKK